MSLKTISFYTLGCRLNQSETASLQNNFSSSGYEVVRFNHPADICVINTCTVTAKGDTDTRKLIYKIQRLNPKTQIALIGCQSQIQKEQLLKLPNVRWVVGTAQKMDLVHIISASTSDSRPILLTPVIPRVNFTMAFSSHDQQHTRANVKIQDGCDFFCSFCEIPYARGRARSREWLDVVAEVKNLADRGYKEIVLTGINLGSYQHNTADILSVIESIQRIAGIQRIRLSSLELTTFPEKILNYMLPKGKLCRYLHVPLQHGSDRILRLMKRRYTAADYKIFVNRAVREVPGLCVGTDIIVGFPGETEEDFKTTFDFLSALPLSYLHVFSYSPRLMAQSRHLPHPVATKIIRERSKQLQTLSREKRQQYFSGFIGQKTDVIFEEKNEDFWWGVTDNYIRVKVRSDAELHNQNREVQITGVSQSAMLAEVI